MTDTDDKSPVDTTLRKYCDINDILYKRWWKISTTTILKRSIIKVIKIGSIDTF